MFTSRDGNISIFRVGLTVGILGIFFIVGGLVIFQFEQQTYRQPLEIVPPVSAQRLAAERITDTAQRVYYQSSQTPEEIVEHYMGLLRDFYPDEEYVGCQRTPPLPDIFPNYQPGNGVVPYHFTCVFDRSTFGADQITTVIIHPGVRNDATGENYEGTTRIEYEQFWQP